MDVDPSNLSTHEEILKACCRQTCKYALNTKNLQCDLYESETTKCDYEPGLARSVSLVDQPEADIKWTCCSAGPKRPEFPGCTSLFDKLGRKCPSDTRIRGDGERNPFYYRDYTKMDNTTLNRYCCHTSCYDQMTNKRKLKCLVATKMWGKENFQNPFNNNADYFNSDMNVQSDADIQSECCSPLNKCRVKLDEKGLSCDGFGFPPGAYTTLSPGHKCISMPTY